MDDISPAGSTGINSEDAFRDGFKLWQGRWTNRSTKRIVSVALNVILSDTSVGEQEDNRSFIYVQHNPIVRLDVIV
ncbi:hypothetical protein Hte_009086 [Hypoxylon texense]